MRYLLSFIMGAIIVSLAIGLSNNKAKQEAEISAISTCDSLHLANDSLMLRIETLDRRVRQYKIGLSFLRDKDKQAYDYVINAGNLDFPLEYEKQY